MLQDQQVLTAEEYRRIRLHKSNRGGLSTFSPQYLFRNGEPGYWLSASDMTDAKLASGLTGADFLAAYPQTVLYQDSAFTTPVTGIEQPVGGWKDKSGRGNHFIQPTSINRPVFSKRVNQFLATATLATQSVTTKAASYKLYFTGTGSIALSGTATGTYTAGANTITCTAGTLTATVTGSVLTADLRLSIDAVGTIPVYQAVVTATNYDYVGFPAKVVANGTNSFMYSAANVDLTSTDKISVFAGLTKIGNTTTGILTELGTVSTATGALSLSVSTIATGDNFLRSESYYGYSGAEAIPVSEVVSGFMNKSGASNPLDIGFRKNGVPLSLTYSGSSPGGNFGTYVNYLFSRAGTSLWFNGSLNELIVCGALTSDAQVVQTETYIRNLISYPPYYGYYGYLGQIGSTFTIGTSALN